MNTHTDHVKNYYSRVLSTSKDLKTTACCSAESLPVYMRPIVSMIHEEVRSKFYGCGVPVPSAIEGCTVLDLGSGSGRDVFALSKLVGENGRVIGIDMTDEQIEIAQKYVPYHMDLFQYESSNVELRKGYIEDLGDVGIEDNSIDLVVSNCVFNLSPDKERLYKEIFRVLKPGGELYFSDVFTDRRQPAHFAEDPVLLGECLGGAQYIEDFRRMLAELGCKDYRVVSQAPIAITNEQVEKKTGNVRYYSITVRAFKLDVEDRCEDYGQVATYKGTIPYCEHVFNLDDHHRFETGKPMLVCSNTALMLSKTRFSEHFDVQGDTSTHYGLFDCGDSNLNSGEMSAACC